MARPSSPTTQRTEDLPPSVMATRLPARLGDRAEAYSKPALTHKLC
jgi:hypothetical protein